MATRTERRRAAVDRRRQSTRKSVTAQVAARRRRSRIRWTAAAAGVAVLGAGAIVLIATRGDDGGIPNVTLTGKEVDAEGALGVTAPLDAYTVDYELTSYSSDPQNPVKGTEQIRVSRPFGSQLTFADDTGTASVYASVLGKRGVTDEGTTTVTALPAQPALYDWRFDATLDDLVASGKFELKERREVAGRQCQVYRTGSPVEANTVTAATETDYADMCIDASGLVLEEVVYLSGGPYQHVIATAVSEDAVDDIAVDGEPTDPTTSFTDIGTDAAPADGYWTLSTVPEGYELVGRYAYSEPGEVPDDATTDTTLPADTTAAPTETTSPPATTGAAATTATTVLDTTIAPADSTAPDGTDAAQGFAGSNVIAAATSTAAPDTTAATTVPAADTTTAGADTTAPADSTTTTTAAPAAPPVVTYFDVYRSGGDYLIVQQGSASQKPTAAGATAEATIEALGTVTTSAGYDGSTILASPTAPADWFVSITGSVDVATLTTIAGSLTNA